MDNVEKITIDDKEWTIRKLKYSEVDMNQMSEDEANKKLLMLASGMTEEEYTDLDFSTGLTLQLVNNKLNGIKPGFRHLLTKEFNQN